MVVTKVERKVVLRVLQKVSSLAAKSAVMMAAQMD